MVGCTETSPSEASGAADGVIKAVPEEPPQAAGGATPEGEPGTRWGQMPLDQLGSHGAGIVRGTRGNAALNSQRASELANWLVELVYLTFRGRSSFRMKNIQSPPSYVWVD